MAFLLRRHNRYSARVRIPVEHRGQYGGKEFLQQALGTSDKKVAKAEAAAWEAILRLEWRKATGEPEPTTQSRRALYAQIRELAEAGEFKVYTTASNPLDEEDPIEAGIGYEIERIADADQQRDLTEAEVVRLAALQDGLATIRGKRVKPRREMEATFKELADDHLRLWKLTPGLKETHTGQQKAATFNLFASYFGARPIRDVRRADGSAFADALRQLDPNWARTGKAKGEGEAMTWKELQRAFGNRDKGLSDATVNRHMATLSAFWKWAEEREYCEGRNPFEGHRRQLKSGKNKTPYAAWETEELKLLFRKPPARADVTEVVLVAMFTGMRLDEIASLTFGQIRKEEGIDVIDITKAKTENGIRLVPLHPRLQWLATRAKKAKPDERVWPKFVPEGPGARPGRDAGKEFSRFKASLGFTDRLKAFHSFRKNVVGQLERARVPENEVAQLVGHAKQGFTFGTYGTQTLLQRRAEIVALIDYPDVPLPEPMA